MLTLVLLACTNPSSTISNDVPVKPDVVVPDYVPTLDPDFPANLDAITWNIDKGVPSRLSEMIRDTEHEWYRTLVCGKKMAETTDSREADIVWRCGGDGEPDWSGKVAYKRVDGQLVISIFDQVCENPHAGVPRHAWGHALGFAHSYRAYTTTMDGGEVAHPEHSDNAMEEIEIRGFEKWATDQGALTCGC